MRMMLGSTTVRSARLAAARRRPIIAKAWQSTASLDFVEESQPKLTKVPSLPLVGSLISKYSNTPPMEPKDTFQTWPELRRRFGDFYSIGIPGLGENGYCCWLDSSVFSLLSLHSTDMYRAYT